MPTPQAFIDGRAVSAARTGRGKDGTPYCFVRVACSDSRKGEDGTWYNTRSLFVDVQWWGADTGMHIPAQGDRVRAGGKLYEETEENEGKTYHKVKMVADFVRAWPKREYQESAPVQNQTPAAAPYDEEPPF